MLRTQWLDELRGDMPLLLQQFLFGIEPREPLVFGAACLVALVLAALSSYLPARRVGSLLPADLLRGE